uniref:Uncharacterized protein n=1 Tax=Bursaphelenchus xylophilus TaxID=6326 RepID=A0A1I7SVJ8_BURXY
MAETSEQRQTDTAVYSLFLRVSPYPRGTELSKSNVLAFRMFLRMMTFRTVVSLLLWQVSVSYNDDMKSFLKDTCEENMICHELDVDSFQDYAIEFVWITRQFANFEFVQSKNRKATEHTTLGDDWDTSWFPRVVCRHPIPGADNKMFVEFSSDRAEVIRFYEPGKHLAEDTHGHKVFRVMSDFIKREKVRDDDVKHSIIYNKWLFLNATHAVELNRYMNFDPEESYKFRLRHTTRWGRLDEDYWSYGVELVSAIPNEEIPNNFVDLITKKCFGDKNRYCAIDPRDGTIHYTPYPSVLRMGDFIMEQRWKPALNDFVPIYRFHHIHMPEKVHLLWYFQREKVRDDDVKHSIIYNKWLFLNATHAVELNRYMNFDPEESYKFRLRHTTRWGRLDEDYWSYGVELVSAIPNEEIPNNFVDLITKKCFGDKNRYCAIDPRDGTIHYTPYPSVLRMGDFIMEQRWKPALNDFVPIYRFHHIHMPENEVFYFSDVASLVPKLMERGMPKDDIGGKEIRGVMPQPKAGDKIFELMLQRTTTTTSPPIESTAPTTSTLKPLPLDAYKPVKFPSISETEEELQPEFVQDGLKYQNFYQNAASDFVGDVGAILLAIFMITM